MKKQIILIHGGEAFNTYDDYLIALKTQEYNPYEGKHKSWKSSLGEKLGIDFVVISPSMPCKYNAKYDEWRIWFEKLFPYITDNVVLIGHSLGGIFLAKYLSENDFPNKILATCLIAAPYDDKNSKHSLADFVLPKNLQKFVDQGGKIFLYHSRNDPVLSFSDVAKYKKSLPSAEKVIFEDKGHFLQEEFPELIKSIYSFY